MLDFLASHSGWDAAADKRLRRLCGRLEAADSFRSLREAFMQRSDGWTTLPSVAPAPSLQANRWTQFEAYPPSAEQYVSAGVVIEAIARGDGAGAKEALGHLAEQAAEGCPETATAARLLVSNLRLIASRADLVGDSRKAWLRQMALLYDPEAWPAESYAMARDSSVLFLGDGPVARHNRIALSSRSAWGVPVCKNALAAVSKPPADQKPSPGWRPGAIGSIEVLPAAARASQHTL